MNCTYCRTELLHKGVIRLVTGNLVRGYQVKVNGNGDLLLYENGEFTGAYAKGTWESLSSGFDDGLPGESIE